MNNFIKDNKYLIFIVMLIIISTTLTPIYAKFTNDYITEDDAVGISFDFNLNIQDIEEYESASIDAFNAQIFNIKISNNTDKTIYYGIWYRMVEPITKTDDIVISKLETSAEDTSGSIDAKEDKLVSIIIKNKTDKRLKLDFGVSTSNKDSNSIEYLDGKRLISGIDSIMYLNKANEGSYVSYSGSNGCSGNTCNGENANYVNKDDKGYCGNKNHKFAKTGWQIAYIKDDSVHLISAGSLECIATDSKGNISLENKKLDSFEKTKGTPKHINNLNNEALKYCNEDFTMDRLCNSNTAWAFNTDDLSIINNMPARACYKNNSESCRGFDEIIIGSGDYWLTANFENSTTACYWDSTNNYIMNGDTSNSLGLRPIIKLDSNVYIVDGDGTAENPYKISNEFIKEYN